ncbi:DUF1573 domain-containing protein [uncultured Cytophaga sp.]|uniref:DUF1573 domain-containing protein n=1 Tax=uncultured Cytophaga sp. TaxID=160238 RepID=UPI00261CACEA|nr:DUF1573 domain-containing protein [uncultured Cytophaga sp.]
MKFIFSFTILLLNVCCLTSIHAQTIKEIGHLEFSDTLINFGSLKEEQGMVSYTFKFVNLGPEHFFIEDVEPSCGCITPDYPTDTILAGEKGEVVLYVDLVNHPGVFKQKVVLKGNASKEPINLYVQGYVTPSPQPLPEWERTSSFKYGNFYLQKNYANYGAITTKNPVHIEIPIYNAGEKSLSLQLDKMKLPAHYRAVLLPTKIESKQRGVIKISFNTKESPNLGYVAESIDLLFLSNNITTSVPMVVSATVKDVYTPAEMASIVGPTIQLDKSVVDLGSVKPNEKVTSEIHIVNIGKADLTIRSIRTSCSCVEAFADKLTLKPGASTVVKIVFDTNERLGLEEKVVSIFSNDASNSIVVVKLKATVLEEAPVETPLGN